MSDEPVILEMFGDADAAQCVGGVCAVPGAVGDESSDTGASPDIEVGASPATS